MRFILALFFIFFSSCASLPEPKCEKCPAVENSRYTSVEQFRKLTEKNTGRIYLLFAADWCKPCTSLFDRLEEAKISHGITFLNIDETWAFVLSRNLKISSVPALVVIENEKILLSRHNANTILVYLLAHVEPR